MSRSLYLPVALPLVGAALTGFTGRRPRLQRVATIAILAAGLGYAAALLVATRDGEILSTATGAWPARFAITLVADTFSALMLTIAMLMVLVCTVFALATGEPQRQVFHPLVLVLTAGICGAFLTADLFNLFVFFEVMLVSSYVLLTLGGTRERLRAGVVYVVTNLFASLILVSGVALTYGVAGTVNFAALGEVARGTPGLTVAGGLLLVAFAVKSSLVPVHGWLPRAYPAAPPAVAALFSGLLTKVGIYAIYRVYSVVFEGDPAFRTLLLVIAAASMILGVLGAVGREDVRGILSFHMVSQVGYLIMGLGLFSALGLAGGIFYMLHYIVVKTALFLTAGAIEHAEGTGELSRLSGLARTRPVLAAGFVIAALSLAGIPPLSGFFAKVMLIRAAFESGEHWIGAVALGVGMLTLMSMVKIWNGVFWGERSARSQTREHRGRRVAAVAPVIALAVVSLVISVGAEGLVVLSEQAGEHLLDATAYTRAVLGP